ncbi:MAG: all-trans-retinol 13,14-reductase [Bacteroidetes bacterium]|jgi:all-trans-retinol 13,14-reductase|nr:all-trans-retinol 13,14-reductase [Bacteroidota bacterium]
MSKYDVVIIGSGLGGLCTAYILAKHGMKVCVLEKNRQIGGSLQIYSRDKTVFETGVHYVGGLAEGQNLNRYFQYFNIMKDLKLQKLNEDAFDVISFEGDDQLYPHAQGYENFIEKLAAIFPHERKALEIYIQKVREACADFPMYNLSSEKKDFTNAWHLQIDSESVINSIFTDKKLQKVIGGNNMLYAGVAGKSPFYVHALVVNSYIESSYRCIDGSAQIAKIMSKNIKAMGGEILNYHEAVRFVFNGNEIESVELVNGERIEGKTFVSAIDLSKTIDMVEGPQLRPAYKNRLKTLEYTTSAFLLNVVTKPNSFEHLDHNIYHLINPDVWAGPFYDVNKWPESVAVFGNTNSRHPGFTENFTAMAYMRFEECEKWAHTKSIIPNNINYRGDDYEAFKIEKSEKLLDALEKRIPGLRSKVQSYTSATPITYRDYIGGKDGSLYGAIKDYKEPLKTFITPRTKVSNLFLTGQNLNLHGVMGVTVSSVVTCTEILGDPELITKIKKAS